MGAPRRTGHRGHAAVRAGDPLGGGTRLPPGPGARQRIGCSILPHSRSRKGGRYLFGRGPRLLRPLGRLGQGRSARQEPPSDPTTVIKMSEAVAGEMVLERLIETLMTIAVEHAGGDRGLLILPHGGQYQIEAEARSGRVGVRVRLFGTPVTPAELPVVVLEQVIHTESQVILGDAREENAFSQDEYIGRKHARSLLCLPLLKQAELIGVLYLENSLASHVFTPGRIAVLKLLASQAAIALENARLYSDVAEREAKIRRLVDANIIGIFISSRKGEIIEANDAFFKMVGYDREDLAAGNMRLTDLTPPEWRASTVRPLE